MSIQRNLVFPASADLNTKVLARAMDHATSQLLQDFADQLSAYGFSTDDSSLLRLACVVRVVREQLDARRED